MQIGLAKTTSMKDKSLLLYMCINRGCIIKFLLASDIIIIVQYAFVSNYKSIVVLVMTLTYYICIDDILRNYLLFFINIRSSHNKSINHINISLLSCTMQWYYPHLLRKHSSNFNTWTGTACNHELIKDYHIHPYIMTCGTRDPLPPINLPLKYT